MVDEIDIDNFFGETLFSSHSLKIHQKLKTDPNQGLNSDDSTGLQKRREYYGKNYIEPKKPKTFLELCWEACQDVTLLILIIAAVVRAGSFFIKRIHKIFFGKKSVVTEILFLNHCEV